jgi:8-oxo-dGTP pyrophosphatase MutT (NUDIX family)
MAPSAREMTPPADVQPQHAAVLVPLCEINQDIYLLLTLRHEKLRYHGGEVSLPGGRVEAQDKTCADTALREAQEETALPMNRVKILGALSTLYIPPSHYMTHPVVGWIPRLPRLIPQKAEVAKILKVPLTHFSRSETVKHECWQRAGEKIWVPYYDYEGYKIWGATAMILSELLMLAEPLLQTSAVGE